MKYGLLTYKEGKRYFNVGDYVQSLAAQQFLPKVDVFLNRENLAEYDGSDIKLIMNGWFTHNVKNWIPSSHIRPLFVSFHLNSSAISSLLNENALSYLKKYEPIGCRDYYTADTLRSKGVDAYFSGCLTLTLDSYKIDDSFRTDNIYIVDPLFSYPTIRKCLSNYKTFTKSVVFGDIMKVHKKGEYLKNILDEELINDSIYVNHEIHSGVYSDREKFEIAKDLLCKYAAAKLVITSRIHCALPCLALGTPVVFINSFNKLSDSCRFGGLLDLFNRIDIDSKTGRFVSNFDLNDKISKYTKVNNSDKYINISDDLKTKCKKFINI